MGSRLVKATGGEFSTVPLAVQGLFGVPTALLRAHAVPTVRSIAKDLPKQQRQLYCDIFTVK